MLAHQATLAARVNSEHAAAAGPVCLGKRRAIDAGAAGEDSGEEAQLRPQGVKVARRAPASGHVPQGTAPSGAP